MVFLVPIYNLLGKIKNECKHTIKYEVIVFIYWIITNGKKMWWATICWRYQIWNGYPLVLYTYNKFLIHIDTLDT